MGIHLAIFALATNYKKGKENPYYCFFFLPTTKKNFVKFVGKVSHLYLTVICLFNGSLSEKGAHIVQSVAHKR